MFYSCFKWLSIEMEKHNCGFHLVTRTTTIEPPPRSSCHPEGERQENIRLITVDAEADYTLHYHSFTQTLDKPMPSRPEKQIMGDSWLQHSFYWPLETVNTRTYPSWTAFNNTHVHSQLLYRSKCSVHIFIHWSWSFPSLCPTAMYSAINDL